MYQEYARQVYPHLIKQAPLVMGIVNLSPDSFAETNPRKSSQQGVDLALQQLRAGADIIDLGGRATNPQAKQITETQELAYLLPVVEKLAPLVREAGKLLSVDSFSPRVVDQALSAGATMINDVRALTEPGAMEVATKHRVPVVLMHDQPRELRENKAKKYIYKDLIGEVLAFLKARIRSCEAQGLINLIVDPGVGFSKNLPLNLHLLRNLAKFKFLDKPLLIGASNKKFIGTITGVEKPSSRINGSLTVAVWSVLQGAAIIRTHQVGATKQAITMIQAITGSPKETYGSNNVQD